MSKEIYENFFNKSIFFVINNVDNKYLNKKILKIIPNFSYSQFFEYIYDNYDNVPEYIFITSDIDDNIITNMMIHKDKCNVNKHYLNIFTKDKGYNEISLGTYNNDKIFEYWTKILKLNIPKNNITYYNDDLMIIKKKEIINNNKDLYLYYSRKLKKNEDKDIIRIALHQIFKI